MHAYWPVGSSSTSKLLSRKRALARQKSCRWPCESKFSSKGAPRPPRDVTLPHKSTRSRAWIIAWSETASSHGLAFSRTVPSNRKGSWVTRLSLDRTNSGSRVDISTPSISICPWWHGSRHSKAATRLLLPLWTAWSGGSAGGKYSKRGCEPLTCPSFRRFRRVRGVLRRTKYRPAPSYHARAVLLTLLVYSLMIPKERGALLIASTDVLQGHGAAWRPFVK